MTINAKHIPEELIYEMVDGVPIYYNGYQNYLNGTQNLEELVGSSYLQSDLITKLVIYIGSNLDKDYKVLSSELGLQFTKNSWRSANIAIVEKIKLKAQRDSGKYLEIPPKVVIEIDTKASLSQIGDLPSYFHNKTDQLLNFGVEEVIWIFTESKKIMLAQKDKDWLTFPWEKDFQIMDALDLNLITLLKE